MEKIIKHKILGACFGAFICILFMFFTIRFTPNWIVNIVNPDSVSAQTTTPQIDLIRFCFIILSMMGLVLVTIALSTSKHRLLTKQKISFHFYGFKAKCLKTFLLIVLISNFFCLFLYRFFPKVRPYIYCEDYLIEDLSALLFLFAFFIGCYSILVWRKIYNRNSLIVTILAIFGFFDELSFGERLFDIKMPNLYGIKIDGIHDFFELGFILADKNILVFAIITLISLLCVFTVIVVIKKRRITPQKIYFYFKKEPTNGFLFFFGILVFFSLIVDCNIISWQNGYRVVLEEVSEMNAALALVFSNLFVLNFQISQRAQKRECLTMPRPEASPFSHGSGVSFYKIN
jgi:hypothetical protein